MNTIQKLICRCGFITLNRLDRMKHLKSKEHKIFCKEIEKENNLKIKSLDILRNNG